MAGDWIKMRIDLQTHPKVVRIMSALKSDKYRVIGGLHAVWSVFDAHTEDGVLAGYSLDLMDGMIGWPGFSAAMMSVDWLQQVPEGLVAPEFDTHNGQSAKRRCTDTERKRVVRKMSASEADKTGTREEKRREEVNLTPKERASTTQPTSTASGRVCAHIRKAGIQGVNPSNPKLLALLKAGVPEAEFCDLASETGARGKSLAWLLAAIEGRRRDVAALSLPSVAPPKAPNICACCGGEAIKRIGRDWYCGEHHQFSERETA